MVTHGINTEEYIFLGIPDTGTYPIPVQYRIYNYSPAQGELPRWNWAYIHMHTNTQTTWHTFSISRVDVFISLPYQRRKFPKLPSDEWTRRRSATGGGEEEEGGREGGRDSTWRKPQNVCRNAEYISFIPLHLRNWPMRNCSVIEIDGEVTSPSASKQTHRTVADKLMKRPTVEEFINQYVEWNRALQRFDLWFLQWSARP